MRAFLTHLFCFTLALLLHLLVLLLAGKHLMRARDTSLPTLALSAVALTMEGPAPASAVTASAAAAAVPPAATPPMTPPEPPDLPDALPQTLPLPDPRVVPKTRDLPEPLPMSLPDLPEPPPREVVATPAALSPPSDAARSGSEAAEPSEAISDAEPGGSAAGQVTAHPALERTIRPAYPIGARRRGEEGTVVLDVKVAPDGRSESVTVVTSSGFPELDRAATRAAARARFKPGRRDGKPVAASARLTLIFRLRET